MGLGYRPACLRLKHAYHINEVTSCSLFPFVCPRLEMSLRNAESRNPSGFCSRGSLVQVGVHMDFSRSLGRTGERPRVIPSATPHTLFRQAEKARAPRQVHNSEAVRQRASRFERCSSWSALKQGSCRYAQVARPGGRQARYNQDVQCVVIFIDSRYAESAWKALAFRLPGQLPNDVTGRSLILGGDSKVLTLQRESEGGKTQGRRAAPPSQSESILRASVERGSALVSVALPHNQILRPRAWKTMWGSRREPDEP